MNITISLLADDGAMMQPAAAGHVDDLSLTIAAFPTAFPKGPAIGKPVRLTWGELCDKLRTRRQGKKDGPNFIPATFKPEPDGTVRRLAANLTARTAIVLDIETNKQTGEVPPSIAEAVARIERHGLTGCVYTSHNHQPDKPRYRIVLPLSAEIAPELPAAEATADLLGLADVLDTSKVGAASLFFLASCERGQVAHHQTVVTTGAALDAAWMREAAGAIQAARDAEEAAQQAAAMAEAEKRRADRIAKGLDVGGKLIEAVRQHLDLEQELLRFGYKKIGRKYLYPESRSGQPGVFVAIGRDGVARAYSHHGDDPIAAANLPSSFRSKAVDAVDVVAIHQFGGDLRKALSTLAKQFGIETKPTTKPEEPPPHPGYDGPDIGDADSIAGTGHGTDEVPPARAEPNKAPDPTAVIDAAVAAIVKEFNEKYLVVNENGKAVIYQPGFDPILKRRRYDRLSPRDLQVLWMNRLIPCGLDQHKKIIYKPADSVWMHHRDRREFRDGVAFNPSTTKQKPGILNLWQGFAVKPKPGNWSLMHNHMRDIICCGDKVRFDYLMGWIARMLQHPGQQGEVAVVMKGGEGTGKGTVARALRKIMGQHGMQISNAKHLVGNFNGHLRDCVFLFADEAFFAGDRQHIGVLKTIITEDNLSIEAKFQNAVEMPNFLHLMMASNEDWVVPASIDARRFFVLEVDENNANKHDYFAAIWEQMEAGGYEAMLADLLAHDLTRFNVRAVPQTQGLQQQRKLSLPVPESWWIDCLQRGYVFRSKLGLEAEFGQWREVVSMELLFASYREFARDRHERRPLSREDFGKFMKRMGGTPSRPQRGITGEHLTDEPTALGSQGCEDGDRTAAPQL